MLKRLTSQIKRYKWYIVAFITTIVIILGGYFQVQSTIQQLIDRHTGPTLYGATFVPEYAERLGLDWHETYLALLEGVGIKRLRLTSFWSRLEPTRGSYDYSELDWELEQAKSHGANVSLSIGLRQPRYPECHEPDWATKLGQKDYNQALINFVAQTVNRYKDDPTVTSWQLENEAVNKVFGTCRDFNRERLQYEYDLVKKLDPSRPIVMSVSNEYGLPLGKPRPDIFSLSVYRIVNNKNLPGGYFYYPFTPLFHQLRAAIIERFIGRPVIVGELQAEPWGPAEIQDMSMAEQNKSMDASKLTAIVSYARATGLSTFDLWGAEWWYWRKVHGDPTVWDAAKAIYK